MRIGSIGSVAGLWRDFRRNPKRTKFIFAWVDEFKLLRLRIEEKRFQSRFSLFAWFRGRLFLMMRFHFVLLGHLRSCHRPGFESKVSAPTAVERIILEIDLGCDGSILKFHVRTTYLKYWTFGLRSPILLMTRVQIVYYLIAFKFFRNLKFIIQRFEYRNGERECCCCCAFIDMFGII